MVQIIEQTDEEKMTMYMKFPKKDLAKMLIECNKVLSDKINSTSIFSITEYLEPKTCDCSLADSYTAKFMCHGKCAYY